MSYQVEVLYTLAQMQNPNNSHRIILQTFDNSTEAQNYFNSINSKNINKEIISMGKEIDQWLDFDSRFLCITQMNQKKKL